MNESAIAAQVATNMPTVEQGPPPVLKDVVDQQRTTELEHELMDFFKVGRTEEEDAKEPVRKIVGWLVTQTGSEDRLDVLTALRELEGRLGLTYREGKLASIYNYLKLDNQRRQIEREMALV